MDAPLICAQNYRPKLDLHFKQKPISKSFFIPKAPADSTHSVVEPSLPNNVDLLEKEMNAQLAMSMPFEFEAPKEHKTGFFNKPYAKFIIPATLITYGVATRLSEPLKELDWSTNHEIGEHYSRGTGVDDYLHMHPQLPSLA